MNNQTFKEIPPKKILYDFLDSTAFLENNYYVFSKTNYKAAVLKNIISPFMQNITKYYYKSKLFYIDKATTYKGFITVLRQICKSNQIPIHSFIKYYRSEYVINYKILSRKSD